MYEICAVKGKEMQVSACSSRFSALLHALAFKVDGCKIRIFKVDQHPRLISPVLEISL